MMIEIELVRTQAQADAAYELAHEFIDWMRGRYPEMDQEIADYLEYQDFDTQIRDVLTYFNPPAGESLLARHDGDAVGILMLKDVGDGECEMNRMYVREDARGLGAGRALVENLIVRAREMGFHRMSLSALPRHFEAIPLYRSLGFVDDDRPHGAGNTDVAILMKLDLR